MIKPLLFVLGTFTFTFSLAPLVINFLYRWQIREEIRREGPKTHLVKEGTPTMAGILIVVSVAVINFFFNLTRSETYLPIFALMAAGFLGVLEDIFKIHRKSFVIGLFRVLVSNYRSGFYKNPRRSLKILLFPWRVFKETLRALGSRDDVGLKSYQKFLLQLSLGSFLAFWFYGKLGWQVIWLPLFGNVAAGFWYPFIISLLFVFFLNSVGVTDGLDGLAGGLLSLLFAALGLIALVQNQMGLALFCATVVGSLLAFLYFNFYPARVFMGNVGSHSLGSAAVVVSVMLRQELVLLILGGVFLIEMFSVIFQVSSVKLYGRRLFRMAPLHHHFELLGWPETKVTLRFWLVGIICTILGLIASQL